MGGALPTRWGLVYRKRKLVASLLRSRQRIIDHGEVFTPPEIVEAMLDLVKTESGRIDSRFLESACGSGNFLIAVLRRSLAAVEDRCRRNELERKRYALLAPMSLYGIELAAHNVAERQENLTDEFVAFVDGDPEWKTAGRAVLKANVLWADVDSHDILSPVHEYPPVTYLEVARGA